MVQSCSSEGCSNIAQKEECALGMEQRSNSAAFKVVQTKEYVMEYAGGTGQIAILSVRIHCFVWII